MFPLALLASCYGTATMRGGDKDSADAADRGQTHYSSPAEADRDLARFDRENPQCQLWTNWQKTCARTGPGGATHCTEDPQRPVAPSQPFCVRPEAGQMSIEQARSHDRFCAASGGESGLTTPGQCRFYQDDRPFSGYHLAAMRSPVCRRWVDAGSRSTICTEGISGPGGCEATARNPGSAPLACDELVASIPCRLHPAGIVQHTDSEITTSDLMLMPTMTAVNGLSCLPGNVDAE